MDLEDYFRGKGNFLNTTHVAAGALEVSIASVGMEYVGGEEKPVICFNETEYKLVLNLTNYKTLVEAFRRESAGWIGKKVTLYLGEAEYKGKMVDSVRIRVAPEDVVPPNQRPAPKPRGPKDDGGEIPF